MQEIRTLKTPAYVCEEILLEKNLKLLYDIKKASGVKIILALKGFAMWSTFDLVGSYLDGCTASGLHEATLAKEEMGKEVHTYAPAFKAEEVTEIAGYSNHMVFNSTAQLLRFKDEALAANPNLSLSLRINPEHSSSPVDLYNPCAPYSRLGVTLANFDISVLPFIAGLNFHALCEQGADALESVLKVFEKNFSHTFSSLKYVNFGGGHHITKQGYDVEKLINLIKAFKSRYPHLDVYLEPGEAVGWETGYLVSTVLDIVDNGIKSLILDTSAEAHMPDTLAMPYRAMVRNSGKMGEKAYDYRLTGCTCLAGDIMGDYSFDKPVNIGDQIIFEDQIHYTFVKNTTFNGVVLPSLVLKKSNNKMYLVKSFGYETYKERLS